MIYARSIAQRSSMVLAVLCICMQGGSAQVGAGDHGTQPQSTAAGAIAFTKIKALEGEWEAPLKGAQQGKIMVNTFHVIGSGSAVVHGEWLEGKQLTTTIFYMVGPELRADHYCDLENQPRFVVTPSGDGSSLNFALRDITNVDVHPRHFHATTWRLVDPNHLVQDWQIAEAGKETKTVRMEFTRKESISAAQP
jgi:hypothetical protein